MIIAILSDIHGNLAALESVHRDIVEKTEADAVALLGDIIDYGQHSNEVIQYIKDMRLQGGQKVPLLCNIFGNHEDAACNDTGEYFSSGRTRACAAHTKENLNEESWQYIKKDMSASGQAEFKADDLSFLAVHGSKKNPLWGSIYPEISTGLKVSQAESELEEYRNYDVVLSGHTHVPHYFEGYIKDDTSAYRGRKKIIFINPGSVGQPRNHCPMSQYALFDTVTGSCILKKVKYDIEREAEAFDGSVDDFYRRRLFIGV